MKKVLLTVFTIIAFVASANSQIKFGFKAGVNIASLMSSEDGFEADNKVGLNLGGFVELSISEKFSIQPELAYSVQGAKSEETYEEEYLGFTYTYKYKDKLKLNYLNIPVLFKFKPSEMFYIGAGPQIGVLLSAEDEYSVTFIGSGLSESESGVEDVKDQLNGIDLSLAIGAGVELKNGLNFDLRYNYGLLDIVEENDGDAVRNSVIQVTVGFSILK